MAPKITEKDPDGYAPSDIIQRLYNCLDLGRPGLDYTFLCRPENDFFYEHYIINDSDRINILRKLTVENYDGWDYSNNSDFPNDIVHIFHTTASLLPRGQEDACEETVKLYIKITWTKPQTIMIVISFHD